MDSLSLIGSQSQRSKAKPKVDWWLFSALIPIFIAGLLVMNNLIPEMGGPDFFGRQLTYGVVCFGLILVLARIDFRFLRRTPVVVFIYVSSLALLLAVFAIGYAAKGAKSWISLGGFSIQPADFAKLAIIILLAKYFSRRHVEIRYIKHIIVSGTYAFLMFMLVALQPDFGSSLTIFMIWFGMVLVSGISKKHLLAVFLMGSIVFAGLWGFAFKQYQKDRIMNFLHPLADIRGSGYNAYQSVIAVGSGQVLGKGVGYGTQSRLSYLPEYETDFVFAAFAEEWGFIGVLIMFLLFGIMFVRIFGTALKGETNFETLFALGVAIYFMAHLGINIGMNIGLMPVTGIPVPFMSYGGSHLLTECIAIGIIMSMRNYARPMHRDVIQNEFLGIG